MVVVVNGWWAVWGGGESGCACAGRERVMLERGEGKEIAFGSLQKEKRQGGVLLGGKRRPHTWPGGGGMRGSVHARGEGGAWGPPGGGGGGKRESGRAQKARFGLSREKRRHALPKAIWFGVFCTPL